MNKRDFIIQYVLNRAATCPGELKGSTSVEEALIAWHKIEEGCFIPGAQNVEEEIRKAVGIGFDRDYTAGEMTELILASIKGEA